MTNFALAVYLSTIHPYPAEPLGCSGFYFVASRIEAAVPMREKEPDFQAFCERSCMLGCFPESNSEHPFPGCGIGDASGRTFSVPEEIC